MPPAFQWQVAFYIGMAMGAALSAIRQPEPWLPLLFLVLAGIIGWVGLTMPGKL